MNLTSMSFNFHVAVSTVMWLREQGYSYEKVRDAYVKPTHPEISGTIIESVACGQIAEADFQQAVRRGGATLVF